MRTKLFFIIFFCFTVKTQIIYSLQTNVEIFDVDKFLNEVQHNYKNLENFIVEFTRETSSPAVRGKQISRGKLYFLNKNKYRLEVNGQLIVSDGETIYNYFKKAKRIVITKFEENFFSSENLLTNLPQSSKKEFLGEENLNNKKVFKFQFYPASSNMEFKSLILWITGNKIIQRIQVEDWAGNVYILNIISFSKNKQLRDDLIKFKIPAGVKVVDLR